MVGFLGFVGGGNLNGRFSWVCGWRGSKWWVFLGFVSGVDMNGVFFWGCGWRGSEWWFFLGLWVEGI
jgi:hypothetical protein